MNKVGLYIHVPFCLSKCPYCDFYSVRYETELAKSYAIAVKKNIALYKDVKFDSIYFGGGTPILLWREICDILSDISDKIVDGAEITAEANPCCTDREALSSLKAAGLNRVSFGLQSSVDRELKALGRRHDAFTGEKAVELAYSVGIKNISADIMLGIPEQTPNSAAETVRRFTSLPLTHISAYMLKIEPNTPFAKQKLSLPDEDGYADIYLETVRLLEENGFDQYEISNFAKSGGECRHNLKYWRCEQYIGVGPAAHSYFGGKRFAVPNDLEKFIKCFPQQTRVTDGQPGGFEEYMMLKLRLSEGVDLDKVQAVYSVAKRDIERKLKELPNDLYRYENGTVALTPKGFLVSNAVIGILTDIT